MRRAAIATTVAVVAAGLAQNAGAGPAAQPFRPLQQVQIAGYCIPHGDDVGFLPRTVGATAPPPPTTKPIAILDTGVDPDVPELAGRVLPGVDALSGQPVTGDPDGHGTSVAGIAAGAGPGMSGISPTSPILPIRIYTFSGATTTDAIVKGIKLAVARGAGVINLSSGAKLSAMSDDDERKLLTAIDEAYNKNVLVVAAAGNDGDSAPAAPSAFPHVLVAGSSTPTNLRSGFTSFGPWLDVLTPAESLTAPLPLGVCALGYGASSGTSYSAPALSGAAALVQQARPELTTQQQFDLLRSATTDLGPVGRDDDTGFGLLDVGKALTGKAPAKATTPEVDDDLHWLRGAFAKAHPALLTAKKLRFKVQGSISPAKDPADVYPVRLNKGERIVVSATASIPTGLLALSILRPTAGDWDVTDDVYDDRPVATPGVQQDPRIELTVTRTGTYYIAVESTDPVDPDDPSAVPPDAVPYTLSAYKQHKKAKKKTVRRAVRRH
jgi:hypothetical protein